MFRHSVLSPEPAPAGADELELSTRNLLRDVNDERDTISGDDVRIVSETATQLRMDLDGRPVLVPAHEFVYQLTADDGHRLQVLQRTAFPDPARSLNLRLAAA